MAIQVPNAAIWAQTYMKRHETVITGTGEFTYTSELKKLEAEQATNSEARTEYFGYFHLSNPHNDSENREVWDSQQIRDCMFGRAILHCIRSSFFNPWSVMERHPFIEGEHDIYLIYACGPNFILNGASLKLEVAQY